MPATAVINLRASVAERTRIDEAAQMMGKSRTDFMLEAAREKAQQVLLDQTAFTLDAAHFRRFAELLDAPPKPSKAVLRLLSKRAPWET